MIKLNNMKAYIKERDQVRNKIDEMKTDLMRAEAMVSTLTADYEELIREAADDATLKETYRKLSEAKQNVETLKGMVTIAEQTTVNRSGRQDPKALLNVRNKLLSEATALVAEREEKRDLLMIELNEVVQQYYNIACQYGVLVCEENNIHEQIKKAGINTNLHITFKPAAALPLPTAKEIKQKAHEIYGIYWV